MRARLGGAFFLYYGYVGASQAYLAPYLRGLQFPGSAIGTVTMAAQLVAAPAALVWAHAADRRAAREPVLRTCALGALLAICWLPAVRSPLAIGGVLVAHSAFAAAVIPLLDSITMEWARAEASRSYARTRLFGSLGFVAVAQGLGAALSARGERGADSLVPLAMVACVAGYAILLNLRRGSSEPQQSRVAARSLTPAARSIFALLRNASVLSLFALCFIHWAACAPYHLLFGVLVRDHGLPSAITGAALSIGVLAELVALWAFPVLLRRFDLPVLLAAACAASALRWWLVSRAHAAAPLVLLQLFHAATFGLWWACAIEAMGRLVPVSARATGQALFSALVFGAGNAIGYELSGEAYQRFGSASPLFGLAGALELCTLPLCALAARHLASTPGARADTDEGGAPPGSA
ncbi:MAG TPA: MFS transporter [Myxococcales bacterium]|nr:MFS transporter [Myxococcales bacterium]